MPHDPGRPRFLVPHRESQSTIKRRKFISTLTAAAAGGVAGRLLGQTLAGKVLDRATVAAARESPTVNSWKRQPRTSPEKVAVGYPPSDGPRSKRDDQKVDGLTTGGGAHDVIVDHCSFAWGTDENLSASGPRFNGATPDEWRMNTSHRVTFSHCIVGEGVHESNAKGTLIHDKATDIAIIGNLYISNDDRNPLFKGGVRAAAISNLIHNPGMRVMQYGYVPGQWTGHELQRSALVMVGNVTLCPDRTVVARHRDAVLETLAHYRYDRLRYSQFFPVESAWWRLAEV